MSEAAEVIALLGRPGPRFRTLRAVGREWRHHARLLEAFERGRPAGSVVMSMRAETDGPGEQPEEGEEVWRLWIQTPDRLRAEFALGVEMVTVVFHGETWWSWAPLLGARTNAGQPSVDHGIGPGETLIDPAPILPAVELDVLDRTSALARDVWRVRAVPVGDPFDRLVALHGLGTGADEYELLVDAERGLLLRAEARLGGEPFRVIEITDLALDEELAPEAFEPVTSG